MAGMAVAAASAATASFTGLRGLALVAGWPDRIAWLLPVTIDAYAMTSAREADAAYRAAHVGRSITRDALRAELRIAGPRATEIRRQLVAEAAEPPKTDVPDRKEALPTP